MTRRESAAAAERRFWRLPHNRRVGMYRELPAGGIAYRCWANIYDDWHDGVAGVDFWGYGPTRSAAIRAALREYDRRGK